MFVFLGAQPGLHRAAVLAWGQTLPGGEKFEIIIVNNNIWNNNILLLTNSNDITFANQVWTFCITDITKSSNDAPLTI